MPLKQQPADMGGVQAALGIACIIAISLMIFSCIYFIIELYDYWTYEPPPPPKPIPHKPTPLPSAPVIIPMPSTPPPSYVTVVSAVRRDDPFIRSDLRVREPVHPPLPVPDRRSPSPMEPVGLPEVDVRKPACPDRMIEPKCLSSVCQEYFRSLDLNLYFQQDYDCYCTKCHPNNSKKKRNRGGYDSTIPYGWVRFRIETDQAHTQEKRIFRYWATSYYGTSEEKLEQILRNRFIPLPGDALSDGSVYSDTSGYNQHWLTSPSINYASDVQLSPIKTYTLSNPTGKSYNVQVVLQCKQKPDTFTVQPGRSGICDVISSNVIEWKSNNRSTLIPTGLMVRMIKR